MTGDIFYETDSSGRAWARNESPFPKKGQWRGVEFRWDYVRRDFSGSAWYGHVWERHWISNDGKCHRTWKSARDANAALSWGIT